MLNMFSRGKSASNPVEAVDEFQILFLFLFFKGKCLLYHTVMLPAHLKDKTLQGVTACITSPGV